jgi:hypothetical protein
VLIDGDVYFDSSQPGYGLTKWKNAPMSDNEGDGGEEGTVAEEMR